MIFQHFKENVGFWKNSERNIPSNMCVGEVTNKRCTNKPQTILVVKLHPHL